MRRLITLRAVVLLFALAAAVPSAHAQKAYDPGASDTEIKVGNIVPYSGSFSQYGVNGKAEAAYFRMIDDKGGINGRRINFISLDSTSDTGKAAALARQLVEQDKVLLTIGIWGTPTNLAVRGYFNEKKVPQLFVAAPDSRFDDPAHFPWTMGFQASKHTEGLNYARYILRIQPAAKVAILYADDESGSEWLSGIHDGLGDKAATMIVKELPFSYADRAALGAKVALLKETHADVFMNMTVGRYATEAIRAAYDADWHPLQFIPNSSLSIAAFLDPAGLEKAKGLIANARSKEWSGAEAKKDPAVRAFLDWMRTYNPEGSLRDADNVYGYEVAQALVEVLKKCGDTLTRANVMKQAASLNFEIGMLRPGIRVTTGPHDYQPIKQLYLVRFDGHRWQPIAD